MLEEEKTNAFAKILRPEVSGLVSVRRLRDMKEATEETMRTEALQAERQKANRATRADFSLGPPRATRDEGRGSCGNGPQVGMQSPGLRKRPHKIVEGTVDAVAAHF